MKTKTNKDCKKGEMQVMGKICRDTKMFDVQDRKHISFTPEEIVLLNEYGEQFGYAMSYVVNLAVEEFIKTHGLTVKDKNRVVELTKTLLKGGKNA